MMDNAVLEKMIREVVVSMSQQDIKVDASKCNPCQKITADNYPLSEKMGDVIKAPTGKSLDQITIEGIMNGTVTAEDVKISPETLEMQAQVAESVGRDAFARNLRRAAELIAIPDARILEIYNALRPYRSTKAELLAIADELEEKYNCKINSAFIREATVLYEKRGRLKK